MYKYDKKLKEIKPKSLIFVILYGGIVSILLGYIIGFIDYYVSSLTNFSFMMLLFFFSAQFVGNLVRKQYDNPHIVYTIVTGIFLTLQAVMILGVRFALLNFPGDMTVLFNINLYFYYFISFFYTLIFSFSFDLLLMLLVIVVGIYVGIRRTY